MIPRDLAPVLKRSAELYPVVTLTGPRQSGKTTLVRDLFDLPYVSLEPLDRRQEVREDPRAFLAEHADGVIVDEVQHVPELLTYLQEEVDERPQPGRFILTGSQHPGLAGGVSQSLAGRTALHQLHPLTLTELRRFPNAPTDMWETVWAGGYPRIWDAGIPPERWLADYTATYVERDVRNVLTVGDLSSFQRFLQLTAGRTAQEENLNGLGGDAGVTRNTASSWLSVLEATFVAFRIPAWSTNMRRRAVKSAKVHMADTGIVCHLLGIHAPSQLRTHPLRGAIFETWVVNEIRRSRANLGITGGLHHYRETRGAEIDVVIDEDGEMTFVEVKSGITVAGDWFDAMLEVAARIPTMDIRSVLVHGGDRAHSRRGVDVVPWTDIDTITTRAL